MFREKLAHYMKKHNNSAESIDKVSDLFEDLICEELKENHHELYEEFMAEFDELINEITDEDIHMAVDHLCRKDGTKGPKWTREETDSVITQFNIHDKALKDFSDIEFWFAMNYAFAVHGAPNKTISVYIDLALDELFDKNICFKSKVRLLNEKAEKHD
jgi:hypothetical protein